MKIGLERIDMQKRVIVEVLLDSGMIELVMSSEFVRKQEFKLKKIKRPIYIRNMDSSFNKKRSIEYIVEVNIYYQGYRCYDLKSLEWDNKTTLVLSNTRELDRVPNTK